MTDFNTQRIATIGLDLDLCQSPEDVIALLHRAADKFRDDATILQEAWQDEHAGKFWNKLASELDKTAVRARKIWDRT